MFHNVAITKLFRVFPNVFIRPLFSPTLLSTSPLLTRSIHFISIIIVSFCLSRVFFSQFLHLSSSDSLVTNGYFFIIFRRPELSRCDAVVGGICKSQNIGCEYVEFSTCEILSLSENGFGHCGCDRPKYGEPGDKACVEDALIGGFCNQSTECGWFMQCNVSQGEGHCICAKGFCLGEDNTCYVGDAVVGSHCFQDYGCEFVDFSTCVSDGGGNAACTCSPPYHGKDGESACLLNSRIGDFCNETIECFGNTMCNVSQGEGYCTCMTGYHLNESLVCEQGDAVIGSVCTKYLGCEHVNNAMCSSEYDKGRCVCEPFYHGKDGDKACVLNENIGDPCSDGIGCLGDNMKCNATHGQGYCTCMSGFHADDTLACVAGNATVGSTCTKGLGCENITNAECSSETDTGKCICSTGYHEDEDANCIPDSLVGDPCVNDSDCIRNAMCNSAQGSGLCTCKSGFHTNKTLICYPGSSVVGSFCSKSLGCEFVGNSSCSSVYGDGVCECVTPFNGKDGDAACTIGASLGESCDSTEKCLVEKSICQDGKCTCKNGYLPLGNVCKRKCIRISKKTK